MTITDPWVLPKGTIITPVVELPPGLREQVEASDEDFAISRPQSRTPSRILDSQSAALVNEFKTPKTIAQAVAHYSRAVQSDPERTLEDALPMLTRLIKWRLLVPPDSQDAEEIHASLKPGAVAVNTEVLQCVQALEDSEIYQVRRPVGDIAALKILRSGVAPDSGRMFDREAAILRHLAGSTSPALLDEGTWQGRRYLLLEWCDGMDAGSAAASLRRDQSVEAQRKLFGLCCQILRSYARLHEQGVIHSDIHPRNILVSQKDEVRIVDFGLARLETLAPKFGEPQRGGIGFYFEPEYAAAALTSQPPPPATQLGEQYALAALLYSLLTDAQYVDFSLTKEAMMRQIAETPPVPFAERGMTPWPEVENILAKALHKNPAERFVSVAAFADALSTVTVPDDWRPHPQTASAPALDRVVDRALARVGWSEGLVHSGVIAPPRASLTYGAAGIAYGLYRIASQRQDPALLSLADVWCARAASDPDNDESYYNPEIQITRDIVGSISPYHTLSGVHAVQALVSHAMCDLNAQAAALEAFVVSSQRPCDNLDLALGRSGTLLISSLLLDTLGKGSPLEPGPLMEFGTQTMTSVWNELDREPSIRDGERITYLGIAHGWAGMLYAALNWHRAASVDLPRAAEERLQQLIECGEAAGRGIRWPWVLPQGRQGGPAVHVPGWCNGSAGYIFMLTAAHAVFRDDAYLKTAERAAWYAWESADSISNLCCGLAGQAYGLLNFYKHTGESIWLDRARELASRAAAWDTARYVSMNLAPESLYKGEMGVALLAADLADPQSACMPFFEPEGWD